MKKVLYFILLSLSIFKNTSTFICDKEIVFNEENKSKLNNNQLSDLFYNGDYKGQGAYGKVHQIKYNKKFTAVKEINIKKKETLSKFFHNFQMVKEEIENLSKLGTGDKKEFFPEFYGCTLDGGIPLQQAKFMVLQETLETDLDKETICENFINMYTPLERIQRYRDLAMGLVKMHSLNLIHEDLKPGNIMSKDLNFTAFKLIDFGMSCYTSKNVFGGTPLYNSPEKILALRQGGSCDPKHDIWALGLTIAAIEANKNVINKGLTADCFKYYHSNACYEVLKDNISNVIHKIFGKKNGFSKLVIEMISYKAEERPTAQEIVHAIDSMTNKEKKSELINSKISKRDYFKANKNFLSDINDLIRIESNIPEVNNYYKERQKYLDSLINIKKEKISLVSKPTKIKENNSIVVTENSDPTSSNYGKNVLLILASIVILSSIISTIVIMWCFKDKLLN